MKNDKDFATIAKQIHDNFDWDKVLKVMQVLSWEWFNKDAFGNEYNSIPTLLEIKALAYERIKKAYYEGVQTSRGGFTAGMIDNELYLTFNICEISVIAE